MSEKKMRGTILHWCRDEYGEIIVCEEEGTRSLYFGDGTQQSSVLPDHPGELVDDYSQAMMSALMFNDAPRSTLIIGLGGCSLVNFLLKSFPACSLDVVEIRQEVITLAKAFFLLPGEHENLRIFCAPGEDFISNEGNGLSQYDLIIVDAFDDDGPAAGLLEAPFLLGCRSRMTEDGIFAINLWTRPKDNFPGRYADLQTAFTNNTLKLLSGGSSENAIVFGFAGPVSPDIPTYRTRARMLQKQCGINFPKYLRLLQWQNWG